MQRAHIRANDTQKRHQYQRFRDTFRQQFKARSSTPVKKENGEERYPKYPTYPHISDYVRDAGLRIFKRENLARLSSAFELPNTYRVQPAPSTPTPLAATSSPSVSDGDGGLLDSYTSDSEASAVTARSPTPEITRPPTPPHRYRGIDGVCVSEYISTFQNNRLLTVKRKFEVLPGSRVTRNMKRMPERRPITWRSPDGFFNAKPINTTSQNNAIINYSRGREAAEPCTKCAAGNGPFAQCIVGADRANFQDGKGACASCIWSHQATSCSLRPDYWATDTAYVDQDTTIPDMPARELATNGDPVSRSAGFASIAEHRYVRLSSSLDNENPISMRLAMYEARDTFSILKDSLPPLRR
ncbi:uncharacterized protein GIQ15_02672 [Arthroderma uncinatum]|uniref:uncharacterized protein n=1 Tax=Arthroderma uncinatum TaxID=74035 RepID=UPI00144ACDBA|nr:uncharacterized protein GIQ15_02672 [Arthroderma uncinatum]KAF3483348.1 hypothetical protein GIQ15_02672 [Arthroderma uncinatum]